MIPDRKVEHVCACHRHVHSSGVAKGGPSRARPYQSSAVPNQKMLNCLPLCTQNSYLYTYNDRFHSYMKEP